MVFERGRTEVKITDMKGIFFIFRLYTNSPKKRESFRNMKTKAQILNLKQFKINVL